MLMKTLTEVEWEDIREEWHHLATEYVIENMETYYHPEYDENMLHELTRFVFVNAKDQGWCDEDDLDELQEHLELYLHAFKYLSNIPPRQNSHTKQSMESIQKAMEYIDSVPIHAQRSTEWYLSRQKLFSASNLWKLFSTDCQYNSIIYEKCKEIDIQMVTGSNLLSENPRNWGIKYEPVSVMIYEDMHKTKVNTHYGCVPHKNYPIGASPDGINTDPSNLAKFGRLLEIKNIVNRDITGIPKTEYWIQMQIQMEVCDLDMCDFLETRFKEFATEEEYEASNIKYKGVIAYLIPKDNHQYTEKYKYMPLFTKDHSQWTTAQNDDIYMVYKTFYWYLDELSCVEVERNLFWFDSVIPTIQQAWKVVQKERKDGFEHRAPKRKERKIGVCELDSSITLIKLDENGNTLPQ